jgi:DNA adenine methylase
MLDMWYARVGKARPFLKWAGGKQSFLWGNSTSIPSFPGKYVEPFLGSGAVFFHVMRSQAHRLPAQLGDTNRHLIRTFLAVRDDPEAVHSELVKLEQVYLSTNDRADFYYHVRAEHNARHPATDPASFIFLNQTCWNGLYRVNQQGKFNVPHGSPKTDRIVPNLEELLNASAALAQADLRATSWQNSVALAEPGDFIFLDPPYYSDVLRANDRTVSSKYQRRQFGLRDHKELAGTLAALAHRGIDFVLTNSGEDEMANLYSEHGLSVSLIMQPRAINSKGEGRTRVPELVVTPGEGSQTLLDLDAEVTLLPHS